MLKGDANRYVMEETKKINLIEKAASFIKYKNVEIKSIALGVVAGMRSMIAPAVVSHYLKRQPSPSLAIGNFRFMQAPITAFITKILSVAEIVGDKMPAIPNRIRMPQLLARTASGAIVGATLFMANTKNATKGILLGGLSAAAATFGSYYLRQYLDKLPYLTDIVTGGIEDIIAVNTGILIMHKE